MPGSELAFLQHQGHLLQGLCAKQALEDAMLREARESGIAKTTAVALALFRSGRHAMKTVAGALGVARWNLAEQTAAAA